MNLKNTVTLTIESWMLLEWYDGFVSGLLKMDGRWFLAALVTCTDANKKSDYVILELVGNGEPNIVHDNGDFSDAFAALWGAVANDALSYLRCRAEPILSRSIECAIEPLNQYKRKHLVTMRGFGIEDSLRRGEGGIVI